MKRNILLDGTLDTIEAAKYLGVSPWLLRQYDKRGVLKPAFRFGRNRRYHKEELDTWVKQQHEKTYGS